MSKLIDMTGQRFGKLTVKELAPSKIGADGRKRTVWKCICDCGNEALAQRDSLISGNKTSCGCKQKEAQYLYHKKYNKYEFVDNLCIGYFFNVEERFFIDKESFDKVKEYCWVKNKMGYAIAKNIYGKGLVYLHRLIIEDIPNGMTIDHKDGNKLNNVKSNLRVCSQKDNSQNIKRNSVMETNAGVQYVDRLKTKPWLATMTYDGKRIYIGYFATKEEAVAKRLEMEKNLRKEFLFNSEKLTD